MKSYITESARKAKVSANEYELFGKIYVKIQDHFPKNIDLNKVINRLEDIIPKRIISNVETVYVGDFKPLIDRNALSMYVNGIIMISPKHVDENELFSTFLHEFAHAVEEELSDFIYGDGVIEREFIAKRNNLYYLLKDDYKVYKTDFLMTDYREDFDKFMSDEIGYDNLGVITSDIFASPYGCTSLREYFANCFEHYFTQGPHIIERISPNAYKKIRSILFRKHS
jgi:hypothetical protein